MEQCMLLLFKHKTYLRAHPLYRHLKRNVTLIAWPTNLCCGPGMPMSQTPTYLGLQELRHFLFQATLTLAPKDLIPIPLASLQYPCQGAKEKKVQHICSRSQEELRFQDYQLGDKGQKCGSSFSISGTQRVGVIDNMSPLISPVYNQSTVDQSFNSQYICSGKSRG